MCSRAILPGRSHTGDMPARIPSLHAWPTRSVRSRIVTSILAVAAVGLIVAGATTFFVQRDRTLADIDARLLTRVEAARFAVSGAAATPGSGPQPAAADQTVTSTREALERVLARVIPSQDESAVGILDGEASFVPGVELEFAMTDPDLIATIVGVQASERVRLGSARTDVGTVRFVAVPISVGGDPVKGVYATGIVIESALAPLTGAFTTYAVVAAFSLLAIGLVGWFVAGRLLRPIRLLHAAASRITASDRRERIPVIGSDDVSALTSTINDMLDRLDLAMTSQRQLLDDVRHELKTPLTIVRGHLELADIDNPDDVRAVQALAIEELDRMAGLVDDIESLAEAGQVVYARRAVDVADLTADVFTKARAITGRNWVIGDAANVSVDLDPARITQAWLQLAENAAKYSPAGSTVELGSSVVDGALELWVRDEGPGIPPEMETRIFERFGRLDTGSGIRGSGLGLPIVKAIAEGHGGSVTVASTEAGSRFAIALPLPAQEDSPETPSIAPLESTL